MASLNTEVLFFLLLATLYFQFTVPAEDIFRKNCNNTNQCSDVNAHCFSDCTCKNAVYKDNISSCTSHIMLGGVCNATTCHDGRGMCPGTCICHDAFYTDNHGNCKSLVYPNHECVNSTDTTGPCVINAICNARGVCVCSRNFTPTSKGCIQVSTSHSSRLIGRTTVLNPKSNLTGNLKGGGTHHSDSSGFLVRTTMKTTVQTARQTTTPGVGAPNTDSSRSTVKPTVQNTGRTTTPGNSAATVAAVEISAYILCSMLAYVNVPN